MMAVQSIGKALPTAATDITHSGRIKRRGLRVPLAPTASLLVLISFAVSAVLASVIAPHSPIEGTLIDRLQPPLSTGYLLGTDQQGRDIFTRILYGARVSLTLAFLTVIISGTLGSLLGLVAAYYGRRVDDVVMRVVDAIQGLPLIMLALLFAVSLGPGFATVIASISLVSWAGYARVVRGEAMSIRQREFVVAAQVTGCSASRIMLRYLLPNVAPTIFVLCTLQVGGVILTAAGLSFIGAGIPPPTPDWGGMVSGGRDYIANAWWVALWPGLAIVLLVLAVNTLGDWLRETLDPRLKQL